jgi:hypothetical protein
LFGSLTLSGLDKVVIFIINVDAENKILIQHIGILNTEKITMKIPLATWDQACAALCHDFAT